MYSSTPQSLRGAHPVAGSAATPRKPAALDGTASKLIAEGLENAGRLVDHHLKEDAAFVDLSGQLRIATHAQTNISGHADIDYPSLATTLPALSGLSSVVPLRHSPLPPELIMEFKNLQCNCGMGLMPEISRAWLTIDNTLYMWNYVDGKDLAYFDGLNEVVISVGLVLPKPGVFQDHIQFLLCLTTAVEVAILGVSFTGTATDEFAEMHLQPEPLFHLPSDNVSMLCVEGTPEGRVLLGGKDGSLYEVTYQAKDGWFSKRCQLVNQSVSSLSFLLPSFLSFTEQDPLMQLVVDSSRQILYTRSNSNTITVYDLGSDGRGLSKVVGMSMEQIAQRAAYALQTSDRTLFKPLVSISVIPCSESSTLHLLAVTQTGIRFYFTTTPNGIEARPSLLALVHVRLPPGFSPSSTGSRPGNTVHQAFYRRGSLLLASSQSSEKDELWLIDSDMFPFQSSLIESYVQLPLEGRTWAMAESIEAGELEAVSSPTPLPPAVVTQHAHSSRQFILVSTKGSYLLRKQRPVDQLRGLLEASKGGCSESVKAFFRLHRETQACAMCLILATGSNQQVSQWATEAFFKFGGEPQMAMPTTMGFPSGSGSQLVGGASPMPPLPPSGSLGIHGQFHSTPQMASTPQQAYGTGTGPHQQPSFLQTPNFGMTLGKAVVGPEVQLSGKHNGMCRYLARLLRPLWNERIVVAQPPTRNQQEQFQSRYSLDELTVFLEQIHNFKTFFERNPRLLTPPSERSYIDSPSGKSSHLLRHSNVAVDSPLPSQQKQRCEALEFDSTRFLYQLVVRCYECISLWKLVCEYITHPTVEGLSKDMRERLKLTTFQFLVLSGKELTSALISSLLTRFAGDTGVSETLSSRLRQTTPSLFSQQDAVMSKANELVTLATAGQSRSEQVGLLRESLKLYCSVGMQLDLPAVCSRYKALQYQDGILELCLSSAKQLDPQNLGLHFYKSGQPSDDSAGKKAFFDREHCYSCITVAMAELLAQDHTSTSPYPLPSRPGPPSPQDTEDPNAPRKRFEAMVAMALRSTDEQFHVHLYTWFRSVEMVDRLVEIKTPFIEDYLKYAAATQQDSRLYLDLLWRYYEKNNNYAAAARILDQLAHRDGPELTLDDRIEYISRAVMCAKSCNLPTTASQEGEFLHQLEEKMEVARIQLSILDVLQALPHTPDIATALNQLNSDLMDITHLYEHFAEKFNLAECKLAIVHCAGHYDPTLIESLWRDIVDNELRLSASSSTDTQFANVKSKLVSLGTLYSKSERFFPVEYLAFILEQRACEKRWNPCYVHRLLKDMGVATVPLFNIYDKMFKQKDSFWSSRGAPLHVLHCIHSILMDYVQIPSSVSVYEQPSFNNRTLDAISQYLIELQTLSPSTPTRSEALANLRDLQTILQKLALSTH